MKTIKRVISSIIVALFVSLLVITLAYAATGYVSEQSSDFTSSNLHAASGCTSTTCKDSNAKYANQSTSGYTTAWGNWYTSVDNVDEWYTFIPNLSGDWAAVRYSIGNSTPPHEVYYTTVNRNNWKGSYVNLGNFDYSSAWAQMYLPNTCVSGYACDGRRLYYDKSKFIY